MDIKIVDNTGTVKSQEPQVDAGPKTDVSAPQDLDVIAVAQMLDMDFKEGSENAKKIKTLVDWAKTQVDEPTRQNIKLAIRNLESRVGSPNLHETRLTKIHRFAYLELQEQKIRAEKEMLYD